jgi:cytosine/adenosine deaminase-related metal-dependent hydrolase
MQTSRFAGLTFANADIGGIASNLRVDGARIAAVGSMAEAGQNLIDLRGDRLLPGLINAHDHLQLNSLPRPQYVRSYRNAREWIADLNEQKSSDRALAASVSVSRETRLLAGGIKNLLSGVTPVAHHDPVYPILRGAQFPVRVVTEFGWSHSLFVDGEEQVRSSYEQTPVRWPWIIHAAEGVDAEAGEEFDRLAALGCLGPKTLLVHGVALDAGQRHQLAEVGAGLIWCPTSNLTLFGATADVASLVARNRVALGSDSRLTGARDLLGELRIARELVSLSESALESLVTVSAARLLHLPDRGVLRAGARADLIVLPAGMLLPDATRADVRLVMVGGHVLYADRHYASMLAPGSRWVDISVDGRPKVLDRLLARVLLNAGVTEEGVELSNAAGQAA